MTDVVVASPRVKGAAAPRGQCPHCGAPVRALRDDGFCCAGCASAFAIIGAAGLGSFYRRLQDIHAHRPVPLETEFAGFARPLAENRFALELLIDGLDCAACVWLIESLLARDPSVVAARVNLSTRRLTIKWQGTAAQANGYAGLVAALGFRPAPYAARAASAADDREARELLRCLAVAGFAAANVMLLSVAIWSGHDGSMGQATRSLFHWLSAAIALPAVAYAGRPFFRSAFAALRNGRTNMDAPISIGVTLACIVSLHETWVGAEHAFFDSAITLLFFLLIGRYLDRRARGCARRGVEAMLALSRGSARVVAPDGTSETRRTDQLRLGDIMLVAAGERFGADGKVVAGSSMLDTSLISGESLPVAVSPGTKVVAGAVNLGAPLRVQVTAVGEQTVLSEIVRLIEAAERGRSKYTAIADCAARAYAPVVHLTALMTFLGWIALGGLAWDRALVIAVAVLIITCPCALALAVPVVQVIASMRLMKSGVLLLSPTALERLAEVDHVVFDKTGTLTLGRPELASEVERDAVEIAAGMASNSRHPLAKALARAAPAAAVVDGVVEQAGLGLERDDVRLGSAAYCGVSTVTDDGLPELWLSRPGRAAVRFAFADRLRPDARSAIEALRRAGVGVEVVSGDRPAAVARIAADAHISPWRGGVSPAGKVERLEQLAAGGHKVLMVGDGLNDAPALAAAYVSISPSSATEATQNAADAVFHGDRLWPVVETLLVARQTRRLARQNLALALLYNLAAVPLAIMGAATPLVAAVAMSSSSLMVVANALRIGISRRRTEAA